MEQAHEIHAEHLLELFERRVFEGEAAALQHRVVDQHIQAARPFSDQRKQSLDGRRIAQIGRRLDQPLAAPRSQLGHRPADALGRRAVNEHRGALRGEPRGDPQAGIAAGTRHQYDFVGKTHAWFLVPCALAATGCPRGAGSELSANIHLPSTHQPTILVRVSCRVTALTGGSASPGESLGKAGFGRWSLRGSETWREIAQLHPWKLTILPPM